MAEGIDIYAAYQKLSNAGLVRGNGKQFCYIKLCDGLSTRAENGYVAALRRAGISTGGYHYAQPGDAVRQANLLVDRCRAYGAIDLAPCLDLEAPFTPNATAVNFAVAFCRQVRARGYRPCLYANNSMMRVVRPAVVAAVPSTLVWVARYGAKPTVPFSVWQYSQSGHVPGIVAGSVDLDSGVVPLNVASAATKMATVTKGFIESMAFGDTFKDWAGNTQSVKGWMDLQDRGRWEIRNAVLGMWDKSLPNPTYDKNNHNGADMRSHQSYKAWDWLAGANLKGQWANDKLDALTKTVAAQQEQLDQLAEAVDAIKTALLGNASNRPGGGAQ